MTQTLPILDLGEEFFVPVLGGTFKDPILRYRNQKQAIFLGLDKMTDAKWVDHFGKFQPLENNLTQPLAMKYHGHQFQHYNSDLGDGRGFVFAQFLKDGYLFELGTKGSGQTPYSRRGDGRLTLKGAVRELLATDYLAKQRVLTSHTFSIVETAEKLVRHDEPSPTRSAVLFRLSRGHIRIGNFQRALFYQNKDNIFKLLDYSLKCFYPELNPAADQKTKIELFFNHVSLRLADLCASYMVAGFVHGVLNTDNMNVSGESFDYGPYRFLPHYDPYFTAAYFDHEGLYSFGRQPPSFLWNLTQLRDVLNFALPEANLSGLNDTFAIQFNVFFTARFFKKLNLKPNFASHENDLLKSFLNLAPDYYTPSEFPVLYMNSLGSDLFTEISQSVFFNNLQKIIENFFQDLYQNKNKDFETAFLQMLNWTQNNKATTYFSDETLNLVNQFTLPVGPLSETQINARDPSLVIDEIEKIWDQIDQYDDWERLNRRITN